MKKEPAREAAYCLLAPLAMLGLLEGLARGDAGAFVGWAAKRPLFFLLNLAFPMGFCLLIGLGRSQRARAVLTLLGGWLFAMLGFVNHYKLMYRMEPVLCSDLLQWSDAAQAVSGLKLEVNLLPPALVSAAFLAGTLCCLRIRRRRTGKRAWKRPLAGATLIVCAWHLCAFQQPSADVRSDMADHARNEGCLYTAVATERYTRSLRSTADRPEEIRAAYQRIAADAPGAVACARETPNVIFVLSESFVNEGMLQETLALTEPVTPFYESFRDECVSGRLYVPKIGGGTSETEFETLTGVRSKYALNPYAMGLPPMVSVAGALREKGYTATAIHWYAGVYYNRYHNLRMLGFDSFHTTDTCARDFEKVGMFVSDREHYRAVMERMRATESRDFVFCLTMQNHGGYAYDDFRARDGAGVPFANQLTAEGEKIVANYCYLLRRSDEALRDWIAELKAFEEPTMVVFFGDHLPPLGAEVYAELGAQPTGDAAHQTPYFIWSNAAKLRGRADLYAYQLGAYALRLAGLDGEPFLAYVERLRESGVNEDETYNLLCYDALFGKQIAYDYAGLSPGNDSFEIGGAMTLYGFDAARVADAVYVGARLKDPLQRYKLCVNGVVTDTYFIPETEEPFTLQCVMQNSDGKRYNESRTLWYRSTDDLLKRSGALPYQTLALGEGGYELLRETRDYAVFRSAERLFTGASTAATLGGKRLEWQPEYGLSRAGQYAVDSEGRVCVAIAKSALPDGSPEAARAYLKRNDAALYAFGAQ